MVGAPDVALVSMQENADGVIVEVEVFFQVLGECFEDLEFFREDGARNEYILICGKSDDI